MATTEAATTSAFEPHVRGRSHWAAARLSEELYARHGRLVAGLCRMLLRDPSEAEDAAQQVFLSAHRSLLNGAAPREPAAWLAAIARNECWARISARMRQPLASAAVDDVEGGEDPVTAAARRADLAALWRAIRALPPQQREALLLREFGGLRYDELAVALSVTEPAVESLLFRARARLRAQLDGMYAAVAPAVRLLVGSAGPAAAAKAAALVIGAAAVTGTAAVAEGPQHQRHVTAPARTPVTRHVVRRVAAALVATPVVHVAPAPLVVHAVAPAPRRAPDPPAPRESGDGEARQQAASGEDGGAALTVTAGVVTAADNVSGSDGGAGDGGGGRGDGGGDGGGSDG